MDFEYSFNRVDTSINSLEARGYLWLIKFIITEIKLDFDTRLLNRLRLSSVVLSEVLIDIGYLVDASVLTKRNQLHKNSLGSLLFWLLDYLDGRQFDLFNTRDYLKSLSSKLLAQVKIYPTVFICAYHSGPVNTTIFASIRTANRQSFRLGHILEFDTLIKQAELQSGKRVF